MINIYQFVLWVCSTAGVVLFAKFSMSIIWWWSICRHVTKAFCLSICTQNGTNYYFIKWSHSGEAQPACTLWVWPLPSVAQVTQKPLAAHQGFARLSKVDCSGAVPGTGRQLAVSQNLLNYPLVTGAFLQDMTVPLYWILDGTREKSFYLRAICVCCVFSHHLCCFLSN